MGDEEQQHPRPHEPEQSAPVIAGQEGVRQPDRQQDQEPRAQVDQSLEPQGSPLEIGEAEGVLELNQLGVFDHF